VIALGVDTKGEGGYVIVPPSEGYSWVNGRNLLDLDRSNLPPWPDDLRPPERIRHAAANDELEADNQHQIVAALVVIPNDDIGYDDWIRVGMAAHAATGGSDIGFEGFGEFSAKSGKYVAATTRKVWIGFDRNPPDRIGAGTIYYMANEADPFWLDKLHDHLGARLAFRSRPYDPA
jgi:hypothetical protein